MSGKRVLALYAVILFGFAVVLCRIYFLAAKPGLRRPAPKPRAR